MNSFILSYVFFLMKHKQNLTPIINAGYSAPPSSVFPMSSKESRHGGNTMFCILLQTATTGVYKGLNANPLLSPLGLRGLYFYGLAI